MDTSKDSLLEFVSSFSGGDGLRVEERLGSGYVRLRVAEAERRQAKHDIRCVEDATIELLRNARDAEAHRIFVGTSKVADIRELIVVDDGCGIPQDMWTRVFDARVTSKLDSVHVDRWGVHGRGMALFSIKENASAARVMASDIAHGTSLWCSFDTREVTERKDQSTWPEVVQEGGTYTLRGPKNIIRTCVEFAIDTKEDCLVYVGSPSEMIATMRRRVQVTSATPAPAVEGPARATDPKMLRAAAEVLGVSMSERTALRIMNGEIAPVMHAASRMLPKASPKAKGASVSRKLVMSDRDREQLGDALKRAIDEIGERYYVKPTGDPRVTITDGRISVSIPYADDE